MRKAAQRYLETMKKWQEERKRDENSAQLAELNKQSAAAGNAMGKAAADYLSAKEAKVNKLAESVSIMSDIARTITHAHMATRNYITTQDAEQWTKFTEDLDKMMVLYSELRKQSIIQEELQQIDRAEAATKEFQTLTDAWTENDSKLREEILPEMKKAGETVLAAARTAESDAWKSEEEAAGSLSNIASSSKMTIIIAQLLGIAVAMVLGYFIPRSIKKVINTLIGETTRLSKAAAEGDLRIRGNPELVSGEFQPIITGINDTLGSVVGPLTVAANYIKKISEGDIPTKITKEYNGDFNTIKNNLNQCIDALNGLLSARTEMSRQHDLGFIDAEMPVDAFQGVYAEMAAGINTLAMSHIAVTMRVVEIVSKYAEGDLTVDMERLPGKKR